MTPVESSPTMTLVKSSPTMTPLGNHWRALTLSAKLVDVTIIFIETKNISNLSFFIFVMFKSSQVGETICE